MLKEKITQVEIDNIFANRSQKADYLARLFCRLHKELPKLKNIQTTNEIIISSWEYDISKDIIREMFCATEKYQYEKKCGDQIDILIKEWCDLELGELEWPFSAMNFDQRVHLINTENISSIEKDKKISTEVIKFRRIKEINAKRNDYIEYLIFENCNNIIPTLCHRRGVDFYINGEPYDQKVSRSVGKAFRNQNGDNYFDLAIRHPELVAKSLYENQDEERFGDEPRLFIVYMDNNLTKADIERSLESTAFDEAVDVTFDYRHSNSLINRHSTHCYIVLLHKET